MKNIYMTMLWISIFGVTIYIGNKKNKRSWDEYYKVFPKLNRR